MTPRLLVNENFPAPALQVLRNRELDVVAVAEVMRGAADEEVLTAAHEQGRWLITFDRDYGELVFKEGRACPPAIRYPRQESYPPAHAAELALRALAEPAEVDGFFLVITEATVRRRPLPAPVR